MRTLIPQTVLALVAEHASTAESHATLDSLFTYAGCPGAPPAASKHAKAMAWLRLVNQDEAVQPLKVIGVILEHYLESDGPDYAPAAEVHARFCERVRAALGAAGLQYHQGGHVTAGLGAPTKTLKAFVASRNAKGITDEFERAVLKAEAEPREAVSAAANILESIFKHYIAERGLAVPSKQGLIELWNAMRKDLGLDPSLVADEDLRIVLTGLIQVVQGLAAFRTHASSAHGAGPKTYRLEPRHSRLTVHAAHSVALFILESWDRKTARGERG